MIMLSGLVIPAWPPAATATYCFPATAYVIGIAGELPKTHPLGPTQ